MHNLSGISILLFPNIWVKVRGNRSQNNLKNRSTRGCESYLKLSLMIRTISIFYMRKCYKCQEKSIYQNDIVWLCKPVMY